MPSRDDPDALGERGRDHGEAQHRDPARHPPAGEVTVPNVAASGITPVTPSTASTTAPTPIPTPAIATGGNASSARADITK